MNTSEHEPGGAPGPNPDASRPLVHRDLLVRAALESILIVLSVFLALFLDEWRDEQEVAARVETARSYLVREVRANRDALRQDAALPYHLRTRQLLIDILDGTGPQREAGLAKLKGGAFTGVHPFKAQDVAWNSFRSAEVTSRLPPDELFLLASVYERQESLEKLGDVVYAGLVQPSADAESEAFQASQLEVIRTYFNDAIPNERELLALYDRALRELEAEPRP